MKNSLNRREFLKLAGLAGITYAAPKKMVAPIKQDQAGGAPNVLIVVFDAWSAQHCSLYGYPRDTTPHINRLAERATVYHNHYAGGKFTLPGTASLLSGVLPWEHRAFGFGSRTMQQKYLDNNIFSAFENYHRFSYSHNHFADGVLTTLIENIDATTPRSQLFLENNQIVNLFFNRDNDVANVAWVRALDQAEETYDFGYSLFLSQPYEKYQASQTSEVAKDFPRGMTVVRRNEAFLLEDSIDWLHATAKNASEPFFGYYHFFPPHAPYNTHKDYFGRFEQDGFVPPDKPIHLFNEKQGAQKLQQYRQEYDEFLLYIDAEFNRLYELLAASGVLENTWLVLTSDHGEMFERGTRGHGAEVLVDPVVRVPLLIFEPGQTTRQDVYEPTSALDLLPTLTHVTGQAQPDWGAGQILPPYGPTGGERDIFIIDSPETDPAKPLTEGSVLLRRGPYELIYYFGYEALQGQALFELYDLEKDPQELVDLSTTLPDLANEMLQAVLAKLAAVNAPYL